MDLDVFFLSFDEALRERNWRLLKSRLPHARRIHRAGGILPAHQMCASLSQTPFFCVVNGDNEVLDFDLPHPLQKHVYCYRSLNPVNGLVYGFGGIKLFPKDAFQGCGGRWADLSTSLNIPYHVVSQTASVTRFNASPLEAFRGAFRECAKLASKAIPGSGEKETEARLAVWCTQGGDQPFGRYALSGAGLGRRFGRKHRNSQELRKINDFSFLKTYFQKTFPSLSSLDKKT